MTGRLKETTATSLVLGALVRADDFRTGRQLVEETGQSPARVSAALYSLLKHKAVELVEAPDNLWWFATPESDTRVRVVEERTPESAPRSVKGRGKRGPRAHNHPLQLRGRPR